MKTILVCGFTRCGTSLMMQGLQAGGIEVTGEAPSFECEEILANDPEFWKSVAGKAVKLLDPQIWGVPECPEGKIVIWMRRDYMEQAKSQVKMLRAAGFSVSDDVVRLSKIAESMQRDETKIDKLLPGRFILRFEDLIERPLETFHKVWPRLDREFHFDRAAQVARQRPTSCYDGLLELELLEELEAR